MRYAFETMGTTASLVLDTERPNLTAEVERIFAAADERYSLYRDDSELSRVARGELGLDDASAELRDTYVAAIEWRNRTHGAFSPNRPDGVIDLNGIVKARAMQDAADLLETQCAFWSLDVGGDLVVSADGLDDSPWVTGIVDPADRAALLCSIVLRGSRRAIATSGSAERGDHIWWDGAIPSLEFVQATVVADDIVTADVLATAVISGGSVALDEICAAWSVDVLTVDRKGALRMTPGFRSALAEVAQGLR